jgi:hypothetical protein
VPTDLQVGSPGEAARKAFNLRGGFPMQLDETITPVVSVRNLDGAPFRTEGAAFAVGLTVAAVAAQFSSIQFLNDANFNGSSIAVVDSLLLSNPGGGATFTIGIRQSLLAPTRLASTLEDAPKGPNLTDLSSVTNFQVASVSIAGSQMTLAQFDVTMPGTSSILLPLGWMLRGTMGIIVEPAIQNQACGATAFGRYFR